MFCLSAACRALGEVEWHILQVNCHCHCKGPATLMGWRNTHAEFWPMHIPSTNPRHAPENYKGSWSSALWEVIQAVYQSCGLDINKWLKMQHVYGDKAKAQYSTSQTPASAALKLSDITYTSNPASPCQNEAHASGLMKGTRIKKLLCKFQM